MGIVDANGQPSRSEAQIGAATQDPPPGPPAIGCQGFIPRSTRYRSTTGHWCTSLPRSGRGRVSNWQSLWPTEEQRASIEPDDLINHIQFSSLHGRPLLPTSAVKVVDGNTVRDLSVTAAKIEGAGPARPGGLGPPVGADAIELSRCRRAVGAWHRHAVLRTADVDP